MNTNGLTTGNWIKETRIINYDSSGEESPFYPEREFKIEEYQAPILFRQDEYQPIPLTEEWLRKFGFERNGNDFNLWRRKYDFDPVKITITDFEYSATGEYFKGFVFMYGDFMGGNYAHIKFVHQLQNLYFVLTSEELKLK